MPVSYSLSAQGAVEFTYGSAESLLIGYLTALEVGTTTLSADLVVTNPLTRAAQSTVAILSSVSWAEGAENPIDFQGFVSKQNMAQIKVMTETTLINTSLSLNFIVCEYEAPEQNYFSAFAPQQSPLQGTVNKSGNNLQLTTSTTATKVSSLELYEFTLGAAPELTQVQTLRVATSTSQVLVKAWGMATG